MRRSIPLAWAIVLSMPMLAGPAPASAASATLTGRVLDEQGRPVAGAELVLESKVSGHRQLVKTDGQGRYVFHNVPFAEYHLEVEAPGLEGVHRQVELRSGLPVTLDLGLKAKGAEVVVEEKLSLIEDHPSAHLDIDLSTIAKIPATVQSRAMESILLTTPGFVADENGRFHFKGSHGQVTYVIDGVPVTDQMQATFSNSLDPSVVESMEVITGGVSAEYGGKPVGVVNLTSRSGLATPNGFAGDAALGASRFATFEASASMRGGSDHFGWFATAAGSRSDRFLDPVNFENLHNHGTTARLSTRFDWVVGNNDTIRLSVSGGRTDRQVVNLASQEARGQDQRAATADANLSVAWTHLFDATRSFDATVYHRHAAAQLKPTRDLQPGFGPDGPDFPVWAKQDRSLDNDGFLTALTQRFGESTVKMGVQYVAYPIHEDFRFAVTDDGAYAPGDPIYAYTPSGGGSVFHFEDRIRPSLASAYLQSDLHWQGWFLALGLRWDRYQAKDLVQAQLQPRIGLSYRFKATGTVLRASYDRLLIIPENENLALSLSQQAWDLGPQAGTRVPGIRPELQDSTSWGLEQQLGQKGRVMLEYWQKKAANAADNEQFFNTGVLFPVAAARGLYRGWNLRVDLAPTQVFSGYLSLGHTRALFQAPLVGGLQLEEAEAAPGERFLIDHDQKLAAQLGLRCEWEKIWVQAVGRYDSGLVAADPAQAAGNPDLAFGAAYVRLDSEGTWRIKPRTLLDLSAGRTFQLRPGLKAEAGLDLLNATNEKGLYNFLSVFGGTHVIAPRTLAARVKFSF